MKDFEFITSLKSAQVLDKYASMHMANVLDGYSLWVYPELSSDTPVSPLCYSELVKKITYAVSATLNEDYKGLVIVSYSSDVYEIFYKYLKAQGVKELTFTVVSEYPRRKHHIIDVQRERVCRLYRQISLISQQMDLN